MQRKRLYLATLALLVLGLMAREFLIHQEVDALQSEISNQLTERFDQATDRGRVQELASASTVFQSYVEPVYTTSSRLLWPYSRDSIARDWKRKIFDRLDDKLFETQKRLSEVMERDLKESREKQEASAARLREIISIRKKFSIDPEFGDLVEAELKLIQENASERDRQLLEEIRIAGRKSLETLGKKLKRFDHSRLASYVSSGQFSSEIEAPVVELIIQLKSESTRRNAWNEFQKALSETFQRRKSNLLSNSTQKQKKDQGSESKRIAELFNTIARSMDDENSKLSVQAPEAEMPLPVYQNPAGPDYQ